jgi:cysteine desulfurase
MVFLDNAATTKIALDVKKSMDICEDFFYANASSVHSAGLEAMKIIEKSRSEIAQALSCSPEEIFFTSGGTESNNWVIKSLIEMKSDKKKILTSKIEHPSILEPLKWLEKNFNYEIVYVNVLESGVIDLLDFKNKLDESFCLCTLMHVNNEIGSIQPIDEIGKFCKLKNVLFHTDACQSFMKLPINLTQMPIDFISINSHKIHGPKGIGALFISSKVKISPFLHGGGQEMGLRSTTMNTAGIVGFGKATELLKNFKHTKKISELSFWLKSELLNKFNDCVINNDGKEVLPNILNIRFNNILGKDLFWRLNKEGIFVSTSSACSSNKNTPSRVLHEIGLSEKQNLESIRVSISVDTEKDDLKIFLNALEKIIKNIGE